jgi:hypothetical protein
MSRIRANTIVNGAGTGAPDFPKGAIISGISTITADIQSDNINITGVVTAASANFTGNVSIGGTLTYEDVTNIDSVGIITSQAGIRVTGGSVGIGTDNPINNLHVLSGNGDQLLLDNAGERFTQISLRNNGTQNGSLWLDNTTNMVDLYANTNHGIRFKTGGDNERLRITSDGYMTKAPSGMIIRSGFYDTGNGSGASTVVNGTSWQTINLNGTGQVGHNIGKFSTDGLTYNKVSSNSHLNITVSFPYYYDDSDGGAGGFGIKGWFSTDDGSNYYTISGQSEGPCHGWGAGGYGGPEAGVFTYTWNTRMHSTHASTILAKTGDVRIYFQARIWSGTSSCYMINYTSTYDKRGTVVVQEIAE